MSNLRDLVLVIRANGLMPLLKRVYAEANEDNLFTNAAAMAYAWIFAIFPFFIFLLALVPFVPARYRDRAQEAAPNVLSEFQVPETTAKMVTDIINSVTENRASGGFLSLGLLLTLYAASGGMNTTMGSLDQAFDVEKPRNYFTKRLWAAGLTIFVCICAIIIVVLVPIGNQITEFLQEYAVKVPGNWQWLTHGMTPVLFTLARYIIGLTVMQVMIGVVYHFGRSNRERLRFFTPGSVFCGLGWIGLGLAMRFYFENFADYNKTYGTVAGMVVLLTIFYLDSIIFLMGAELDSEIQHAKSEINSHFRDDDRMSRPHA